jgi:hypothetical protein
MIFDTPHTVAYTQYKEAEERISRLLNDVSGLTAQFTEFLPAGRLVLQHTDLSSKSRRYNEQIPILKRALDLIDSSDDIGFVYTLLRSQIKTVSAENSQLLESIKEATLSNFANFGDQFLRAPSPPAWNSGAATGTRISLIKKCNSLNSVYETEILASNELKFLLDAQNGESQLFIQFEEQITDEIERLEQKVEQTRESLHQARKAAKHGRRERSARSAEFNEKLAKMNQIQDYLTAQNSRDQLVQSVSALFGMLQSSSESDEMIRVGVESVIAIARMRASSERTERRAMGSGANRDTVAATLASLRQRLEAGRPRGPQAT